MKILFKLPDMFSIFRAEPLSPSEIKYIKSTKYYNNIDDCRTFTPEDEFQDFEDIETSYSFCRCSEPKARRIVSFESLNIVTYNF